MASDINRNDTIDWNIYHAIHRRKVVLGGLVALLICAIFAGVFFGFMRVEVGRIVPENIENYDLYPSTIHLVGYGNPFLIGYQDRWISWEKASTNSTSGVDDQNDMIFIDTHSGMPVWHFHVNKPSFVVNPNSIDVLTSDNDSASTPVTTASLFCQYCQVTGADTPRYKLSGDEQNIELIKNDTGYYESYLLNANTSNCTIAANLTSQIKGCVVATSHLQYNPDDAIPDFLVLATNITWNEIQSFSSYNATFTLYAINTNGTIAWSAAENQTGSIMHTSYTQFNSFYSFAIINQTCGALIVPNMSIVAFDLRTGHAVWHHDSESSSSYQNVIRTGHDFDDNGTPDLLVTKMNYTDQEWTAEFLSGANGTAISSMGNSTLGTFNNTGIVCFDSLRRFPDVNAEYIAGWNSQAKTLSIWTINATGLHRTGVLDFSGKFSGTYLNLNPTWSCEYNHEIYAIVQYMQSSNTQDVMETIDLASARSINIETVRSGTGVFGSFDTFSVPGIQYAFIETGSTPGFGIVVLGSRHFLFLESPTYLLCLIASLIILGFCVIGIYLVDRSRRNLSAKAMYNLDSENNNVHEISRPLRIFSNIILVVLVASCVIFFVFIFLEQSNNLIINSDDFTVITGGYVTFGIMFASYPLVAVLNNHFSPHAGILYIKLQRAFYKVFKRNRDFRIIVLDMPYARKHSFSTIFMRSLFPVLIAITVGLWLFTLHVNNALSPITGTGINFTWMSDFQLYGSSIFVLAYFLLVTIIPGGWLLDDSGVVYFDEPKSQLQPGDISKVSNWLTTLLKGIFGVTAILNYYRLFSGINFSNAVSMQNNPVMSLLMSIFVIGIYLIFSPIMYGIMVNIQSNASMISDLEYNRHVLYEKMVKAGLDVTPYRLREFFDRRT